MATTNGTRVKRSTKQERLNRRRDARTEAQRHRIDHRETLIEFQPDAVEIEHRSVPGGARWTLYTAVGLIIGAIVWATWAQVDRIVTAPGKLVTTETPIVIQTFADAPIRSIDVKFGDRVKANQVLATLDPTISETQLSQLLLKEKQFDARIARLSAEYERREFAIGPDENRSDWLGEAQFFVQRKLQFDAKIREFEAKKHQNQVQQENTSEEIATAKQTIPRFKEIEKSYEKLKERGSTSKTELYGAQLNTMKQELDLVAKENKLLELKEEATVIDKQSEAFVAEWQANVTQELLKNRQELAALQEEIKKARHLNQLVELRVPNEYETKEFVVFEVADRSIGSVLKSGEPLFKLIPLDVPLEVEIQIDGRDVGRVQTISQLPADGDFPAGSEVKIKLNAFNYQQHGTLSGFLRTVSEGSQERESENGLPPLVSYRGIVELVEPIQLIGLGENQRLMPGMTATAEIKVGRRRVIDYLLYPLFRYLDSSLREP